MATLAPKVTVALQKRIQKLLEHEQKIKALPEKNALHTKLLVSNTIFLYIFFYSYIIYIYIIYNNM